ncbi:MAG: hypothetical protein C0508_06600 [Cyanobacteria bacterium PR.023]|nr:hypothetical protein [Cyanobacteria bacterium PR.023]
MQIHSRNLLRFCGFCAGIVALAASPVPVVFAKAGSESLAYQSAASEQFAVSDMSAASGRSSLPETFAMSDQSAVSEPFAMSDQSAVSEPFAMSDRSAVSEPLARPSNSVNAATSSASPALTSIASASNSVSTTVSNSVSPSATTARSLARSSAKKNAAPLSNLAERPKRPLFVALKVEQLAEPTRELAEALDILPLLREVNDPGGSVSPERKAEIRQKILETVLESYFDVASIQGEAEKEKGDLEALRQNLIDKRDRSIEINNAVNFIASGTLNTVGSVLGFAKNALPFPGNFNQMLSGVVSAGMSTYSLKQAAGGKTRGPGSPTVVAELFGRPVDRRTRYPESVWRFLHSYSYDHPDRTRVAQLEDYWIKRKWLEPHGSKNEQTKLDLVCGVESARKAMTIDDLTDQINIISDISAVSSLMAHHLRDLLLMIDSDVLN